MTRFLCFFAGCALLGCARSNLKPSLPATPAPTEQWLISSSAPPPPKIIQINTAFRFVVLDFSGHAALAPGTRLRLLRQEKPVATIQITEPTQGNLVTADILEGEPRLGDEALINQQPP